MELDFGAVVDEYAKPVFRFIFRLTGDRDLADDLTQETFLKVWKNLNRLDQNRNIKTWIFTIARNTAFDWLRRKKHLSLTPESEESVIDPEPLPDKIFERQELAQELEKALEKLTADYRTIIYLRLTEDLSFEEIAQVVGKPMNTVKSQYRRGLAKLRSNLAPPCG